MKDMLNKIILDDCLDVMKGMPDKCVDLVLTDPPYGIGIDGQKKQICKNPKHNRKFHEQKDWDSSIPSKEYFDEILRISKNAIIWGGNYFNEYLPQGFKGWIIWDKGQHGLTMSDAEIAYSNFDKPTRVFIYNRVELLKDNTFHPTQKPLALFADIVRNYSKENDIIFDPFIGSGTTAVACIANNRQFIGIEKDPDYHRLATERVEKEKLNLFNTGGIE